MTKESLDAIFDRSAARPDDSVKEQLAYRHMIALAGLYEDWSTDPKITLEQRSQLMGMAAGMRELAFDVGEAWNPPEPKWLSLQGFLAREELGEPTQGRTPKDRRGPHVSG